MNLDDAEEYTAALGQVAAGAWRQIALGERLGVPETLGLTTREWVERRLGGYVRLSIVDRRDAAKELEADGFNGRQIAETLGVSEPTVSRDLHADEEPDLSDESPEPEPEPEPQADEPEPEPDLSDESPEPEPDPEPEMTPAEREAAERERDRLDAIRRSQARLQQLVVGWIELPGLPTSPLRDEILGGLMGDDRDRVVEIEALYLKATRP